MNNQAQTIIKLSKLQRILRAAADRTCNLNSVALHSKFTATLSSTELLTNMVERKAINYLEMFTCIEAQIFSILPEDWSSVLGVDREFADEYLYGLTLPVEIALKLIELLDDAHSSMMAMRREELYNNLGVNQDNRGSAL